MDVRGNFLLVCVLFVNTVRWLRFYVWSTVIAGEVLFGSGATFLSYFSYGWSDDGNA